MSNKIAYAIAMLISAAIAAWLLTHDHPFWAAAWIVGLVFSFAARLNVISHRTRIIATLAAHLFIFSWWNWHWSRLSANSEPDSAASKPTSLSKQSAN